MRDILKKQVCDANLKLVELGLVLFTWGNVSAIDRNEGLVVIKPSGVSYQDMTYADMTVVDMDGNVVEGAYRPSSDTPTHIEIYKSCDVGAIVHTHSKWATIWAQAGKSIPFLGTTHADNFYGNIPITRKLTDNEIKDDYETHTGHVITETLRAENIDPMSVPAVLVSNHGPFAWGDTPEKAVENAAVLEYIAEMAYYTLDMNSGSHMKQTLLDKHFLRKHGKNAYYGQHL
jgi:L-ribulose-5-phosphate 4-epimerase